jgi:hypothetical protein
LIFLQTYSDATQKNPKKARFRTVRPIEEANRIKISKRRKKKKYFLSSKKKARGKSEILNRGRKFNLLLDSQMTFCVIGVEGWNSLVATLRLFLEEI